MNKSVIISNFLKVKTHPDLAKLYNKDMEVQVNVAKENGETIDTGRLGGKSSIAFTNGVDTWRPFRIPAKAMSEPEDNDGPLSFNLDKYVEGIGITGWDWKERVSRWVAFDFDAMLGHSDKHSKKLTDVELNMIQNTVTQLKYVTLRKSTSGKGLHLYVFLEPVPTANHGEHAALARSILSMMSGATGTNFGDKVDICGGIMWVWHRKMIGTDGLSLIKQGEILKSVPENWRDHINVVTKKSRRVNVPADLGANDDIFLELSGQRAKVALDSEHKALIAFHETHNLRSWWDSDNYMFITHTTHLAKAHKALNMRGEFFTVSQTNDINCYMFPIRGGGWAVRRYGIGTKEHHFWTQDGKGWTRTFLNRDLTFDDVARLYFAIAIEGGGYQFVNVSTGQDALLKLGISIDLPPWIQGRPFKAKEVRSDYKIAVTIPREIADNSSEMINWLPDKVCYKRMFDNARSNGPSEIIAQGDFDGIVRHVVTEDGQDLGWVISSDGSKWREEPLNHVQVMLKAQGIGSKEISFILGRSIANPWTVVNRPFEPEYPGDRQWNKSTARFKIVPSVEPESFCTWQKILDHCGESLNAPISKHVWCIQNGILNGADYLKVWLACLVRHSEQPLPYLAFYGLQDTGKTTFHEAFCEIILSGGYMDAATALTNTSNFNAELEHAILCTLEEVDLRKKDVYNKVKDLVTGSKMTIHPKGLTPYRVVNYTHWIQCVNERDFIPVFEGDKRITMFQVAALSPQQLIPKRDLWELLKKEASDFLGHLLNIDIPDSRDRLMLPVIQSADKLAAENDSMNDVQKFFREAVYPIDGCVERGKDVYEAYLIFTVGEKPISRNMFARMMPRNIVTGRLYSSGTADTFYGNVSLKPSMAPSARFISDGIALIKEH